MSLTDREMLELNGLCDALVEGTITDAKRAQLEQWLAGSDEVRRYYVRAMDLSASLGRYASEMQIGPADGTVNWTPRRAQVSQRKLVAWGRRALAGSVLIGVGAWLASRLADTPGPSNITALTVASSEYVARITGGKDAKWSASSAQLTPGAFLRRDQRLELSSGFVEVTFDCGAVVLIEGPATFDVNSAWDSTLRHGALTVNVPPQAIGFRVSSRAVVVDDLGTQFSMVAEGEGAADVLVLKGKVEATPRGPESETVLLETKESRRFARAAVTKLDNSDQMFARFEKQIPLVRIGKPFGYIRWSFDQVRGRVIPAEAAGVGIAAETANMRMRANSPRERADAAVDGFRGGALSFDGDLVARAKMPGLSGDAARTIAFWVRTPENAQLSNAYAMAAWRADSEKLGSRPVHIGWNRNPAEGPLGAVRTDFSGGHAMGTTPLRDGRWHHVAVIFLPGDDPEAPVQVKQYVDGKLESNKVTPGERRSVAAKVKVDANADSANWLWLGCRLGANGPRKERFRGEIDELIVTDRSLEPSEVVELMDGAGPALVQY